MSKINLNDFAMDIASKEGKKLQVNIAQIKEIIKIIFTQLSLEEIVLIWLKFAKKK